MGLVEPQVPIGRRHDLGGLELIQRGPPDWEFGDLSLGGNPRYGCAVETGLHEPDGAIGAAHDSARSAVSGWDRKLGEGAGRRHSSYPVRPELGKPKISVGTCSDVLRSSTRESNAGAGREGGRAAIGLDPEDPVRSFLPESVGGQPDVAIGPGGDPIRPADAAWEVELRDRA